jgi:aspartate/tyrosine/aromatic aminotransferase
LLLLLLQIGMFCYTGMTPEMVDQLAGMSMYLTRWVGCAATLRYG